MVFIQQQKNDLNIPLDSGYRNIKQALGNGISNGWPKFTTIEFKNHLNYEKQFAYYLMTCIQRKTGFKFKKQEIKRIKYNRRHGHYAW